MFLPRPKVIAEWPGRSIPFPHLCLTVLCVDEAGSFNRVTAMYARPFAMVDCLISKWAYFVDER